MEKTLEITGCFVLFALYFLAGVLHGKKIGKEDAEQRYQEKLIAPGNGRKVPAPPTKEGRG